MEFTLTHIHGTIADRVAVTDKDGRLVFERVPDGTYLLSETSVPPGYILSDKTYTVIVKEGCDPVLEYEYKNDRKPSLTIYKKCSITGDPLENVGFSITCKDSQGGTHKLGDFYTDQDGKIEFEHLDAAWIQATELAPPNGYAIRPGEGSQELFLKPNGTYTMTFENVPLSAIIIQKTDNDNPPAPLAGAVFELRYLGGDTSGSGGVTVGRYTISLDVGQLRIRKKGSAGGHNGIKSIISHLNSEEFPRIKIGVGDKPKGWDLADYVLGRFSDEENTVIREVLKRTSDACTYMITQGMDASMNQFNKRV